MKRLIVPIVVVATAVLGVGAASAEAPDISDLPEVDEDALSQLVSDIDIENLVSDIKLDSLIVDLEVRSSEGGETVVSLDSDILFSFGSSTLPDAAPDRIASIIADVPQGATVAIAGHTDNIGATDANQKLSEERARAVADAVMTNRSDLALTVEGFGDTKPVEPNESGGEDNPEGRAKNRRVEIRYS